VTQDLGAQLDRLLDQPTAARDGWLRALAREHPELAARLRRLWEGLRQADEAGFLDTPAQLSAGDAAAATEGALVGPWRLLRPLGRGGMAEVWLAERAAGDYERQVALKLARASAGQARRFERERDVMAALTHPCIARLYDAGVSDGQAWIAMEFVAGELLPAAAARLTLHERVEVLARLAEAVQHAHARLVVHRDIKPGNVMLDAAGQPRLLDFGIARLLDGSVDLTRLGASPLTLEFAAPEQLRGERVGVACDVYGLGLLGFVMLAGASPFAARRGDSASLMAAILQGRIARPSNAAGDAGRGLRGDLDAILLRAAALEPEARYASAQALADDLRRHLRGEPVQARPARLAYVAGRWLRRHHVAVAAGALAALTLVGAAAWALHSAQAQARSARRAEAQYDFFRRLLVHDESEMSDVAHRDARVEDVLRQAARELPAALQDAPEARYQLMRDLAPMLDGLGEGAAAIQLLQTQRAQARRSHGEHGVEAAKPLLVLAQLQCEARDDFRCAYDMVHQAWRDFRDAGLDDAEWLGGSEALVGYYGWRARGRVGAEDLARTEHAAALLREHPETKSLANDALALLAEMYRADGRPDDALAAAREGVAFNLRWLGRDNWHTAELMGQASSAALAAGRLDEALAWQQDALAIQDRVWPQGHPWQVRDRALLARLLVLGRDQGRAVRLLAEARELVGRSVSRGSSGGQRQQQRLRLGELMVQGVLGRWPPDEPDCRPGVTPAEDSLRLNWWQRCAQRALAAGDLPAADALLTQAEGLPRPPAPGYAELRRAEWRAARGETAAARDALQALLRGAPHTDWLLRADAWLALSLAAPQAVDERALKSERAALPAGTGEAAALLDEALGRSLRARGEREAARQALAAALRWRESQPAQAGGLWLARVRSALEQGRPPPG
jgi:hypothetical protein